METDKPPPPPIAIAAIPEDGDTPAALLVEPDANGDCRLSLECLRGADAIHLEIAVGGTCRLRAEVRAQAGEQVRLGLHIDETGELALQAGNHQVLFLPVEPEYGPLPPIPQQSQESAWDCCLVIDATTRTSRGTHQRGQAGATGTGTQEAQPAPAALDGFLLREQEQWAAIVAPVLELIRQLGEPGAGCRLAVIAFGDEPPAQGVYAVDLVPSFHLRHLPEDRPEHLLIPMAPDALSELLRRQIKPSPGADFVDALADALAAAGQLQWGDGTRRLLVLIGDSPGHSIAHPVPYGGDALPRRADVDAEAARLHREGIAIMSLYHPPTAEVAATLLATQAALIDHARAQYRRLASDPQLAFTTADFDPQEAFRALVERDDPLGRGACWGRLVQG